MAGKSHPLHYCDVSLLVVVSALTGALIQEKQWMDRIYISDNIYLRTLVNIT